MSKNNKSKNVKRKIDEETVEQLVENRFLDDEDEEIVRKPKKSKSHSLNVIITILSFVLVFAIFFLSSYIFFTASPHEEKKVASTKVETPEGEKEPENDKAEEKEPENKEEEKHFGAELDEDAQEIIDKSTKDKVETNKPATVSKPKTQSKPKPAKTDTTAKKETNKPSESSEDDDIVIGNKTDKLKDKTTSAEKKPADSEKEAAAEKKDEITDSQTSAEEKAPVSEKKPESTEESATQEKPAETTTAPTIVEKSEKSEAIVFE